MSHASTSSDSIAGGYAKFRPGGTIYRGILVVLICYIEGNRVLADDSAVFSLDEDGDIRCSSSSHFTREGEKSRLVECPLDSEGDEEDDEIERRIRINRSNNQTKGRLQIRRK